MLRSKYCCGCDDMAVVVGADSCMRLIARSMKPLCTKVDLVNAREQAYTFWRPCRWLMGECGVVGCESGLVVG
jgi:hypothetical protein